MLLGLYKYYLYAWIALFPVINPIAVSSVFFEVTKYAPPLQRKKLAKLVALYGAALLLATLFIGPVLLDCFGLRSADLRIAGGLIVFAIAWRMLNPPEERRFKKTNDDDVMHLAFFPLTMPITAGAGSIAIIIALATKAQHASNAVDQYSAIALAIITIFVVVYSCYRYSNVIFRVLGKTGSKVITALSAFITLAIAVSLTWSGIQLLIVSMKR